MRLDLREKPVMDPFTLSNFTSDVNVEQAAIISCDQRKSSTIKDTYWFNIIYISLFEEKVEGGHDLKQVYFY